ALAKRPVSLSGCAPLTPLPYTRLSARQTTPTRPSLNRGFIGDDLLLWTPTCRAPNGVGVVCVVRDEWRDGRDLRSRTRVHAVIHPAVAAARERGHIVIVPPGT